MINAQRQVMNLRVRHMAATFIQKVWRGYQVRHCKTHYDHIYLLLFLYFYI